MSWHSACSLAAFALISTCSITFAALMPVTITPNFVADVDANQIITYTLTTAAVGAHVYAVNITDLHSIGSANYTIFWLRLNPSSSTLPKPPVRSDYDPSLIYMLGDVGATFSTNGRLAIADGVLLGDSLTLEIGIRVLATLDVNATLLVPNIRITYFSGPGGTGIRSIADIVAQPYVMRKQPVVTSTVRAENMTRVLGFVDPLPVQPGELVTYNIRATFPQGKLTNAFLIVDLGSWMMDTVTIVSMTVSSSKLTSSCGAFDTSVRPLARLGPDPTQPIQIILPMCTLYNSNNVFGATESISLIVVTRVRTDDAVMDYRGVLGSLTVRLQSNAYNGGFVSSPTSILLAVTGFHDLTPSPRIIEGALPTDRVNFSLPLRQLGTSNAPAYRIRIWDANYLSLPMYNITFTMLNSTTFNLTQIRLPYVSDVIVSCSQSAIPCVVDGCDSLTSTDYVSNGTLAQWTLLDTQVPITLNFQIMFRGRAKAGGLEVLMPDLKLEWWSHSTVGRGKMFQQNVSVSNRPIAHTTPYLTRRIINTSTMNNIFRVIDGVKIPFVVTTALAYPTCAFVDFDPTDADGFCASQVALYSNLGIAAEKVIQCMPIRIRVYETGCLRLDPTPPPTNPSIKLTTITPPEYFNRFPDSHTMVSVFRGFDSTAAVPACIHTQNYNSGDGTFTTQACRYGVYGQIAVFVVPSESPTPSPMFSRTIVPGATNMVGPGFVIFGVMYLLASALVLWCFWFKRTKEEWPIDEFKEYYRARRGDKAAIARRARKAKWRAKGLSIWAMEDKLRKRKEQLAAEAAQAEADRLAEERYRKQQEDEAELARIQREQSQRKPNAKLEALMQQYAAANASGNEDVAENPEGLFSFLKSPSTRQASSIHSSQNEDDEVVNDVDAMNPAASRLFSTAP